MFIGHFGLAFAAKKAAPKANLGALFTASGLVDLLWPVFLLIGIEQVVIKPGVTVVNPLEFTHYPWTHSLLMMVVWGLLAGFTTYAITRNRQSSLILGSLVTSHWFLDLPMHTKDLPLLPWWDFKMGLGGWNSLAFSLAIEFGLLVWGVWIYTRNTKSLDRIGTWGLWSLIVVLAGMWLGASFGPPPPDVKTLAISAFGALLFVAWGWWVDKHRVAR